MTAIKARNEVGLKEHGITSLSATNFVVVNVLVLLSLYLINSLIPGAMWIICDGDRSTRRIIGTQKKEECDRKR